MVENRKRSKVTKTQFLKEGKDICPECGGKGYDLNDNHYLADSEDYERRYPICRRCHGTGHYYSDIDKY